MERLTISLDDRLSKQFEAVMHKRGYFNRSEAIRDLIRNMVESVHLDEHVEGHCMATLSYIYNHHERELASSLTSTQHNHHNLTLSTMHVHMDHDNCLMGVFNASTTNNFLGAIEDLKSKGASALFFSYTEIPLIVTPENSPLPTLDSTRLLAKYAILEALSERPVSTNSGWLPVSEY